LSAGAIAFARALARTPDGARRAAMRQTLIRIKPLKAAFD